MESSNLLINLSSLTCRICLKNTENPNSLFDAVEYEEEVELTEVFKRVTNVEIDATDTTMPMRLCQECTDKLLSAFELIRKVEKSEQILLEFMVDDTIKSSIIELPNSKGSKMDEHVNEEEDQELEFLEDAYEIHHLEEVHENDYEDDNDSRIVIPESIIAAVGEENVQEQEQFIGYDEIDVEDSKSNINLELGMKALDNKNSSALEEKHNVAIGSRLGMYETSKWHKCDACERKFAKEETLKKHIQIAHTYASPEQIAAVAPKPTKDHPIQCTHCPRIFVRKNTLQRHLIAMHADTIDESTIQTMQQKKKVTYKRGLCPYCGESFPQASLIIHIRRHTGEKPYKCENCDKGFPRRQDLIIHQRQHSGERPHVCTVCGKSFIRPNKLARHMRIHTGQRPYKCEKCTKAFSQSNDLKIHMRRHTGEKPYKCGICGEAFIIGTALKAHRKLKSHFEPTNDDVDPYAKIRVSNRNTTFGYDSNEE